ncbi:MAG: hypothetical protein R3C14_38130 [Caldilineaceae bacterium]
MRTTAQHEVFSRSRSIDLLVECAVDDVTKLSDTVFAHFRRVNALEFKGIHDPLTAVDFNLIMMRAWGVGVRDLAQQEQQQETEEDDKVIQEVNTNTAYLKTQEIAEVPSQRTVTIVCVTRPQKILDTLRTEFGFTATTEAGIYCNNDRRLPVWIIHPTELELKATNYPLLPLARGKKLEQFIELCIVEELVDYLQLTVDIGVTVDPDAIWHKIMELVNMTVTVREETWSLINEFFHKMPEAIEKLPTLQETMEAYARKVAEEAARKAAEEAEIRGEIRGEVRGEIRGEIRGEARGEIKTRQQTLLLVLRHRFGELPHAITEQVEETVDLQKLQQWFEEALDANDLAHLSFPADPSQ